MSRPPEGSPIRGGEKRKAQIDAKAQERQPPSFAERLQLELGLSSVDVARAQVSVHEIYDFIVERFGRQKPGISPKMMATALGHQGYRPAEIARAQDLLAENAQLARTQGADSRQFGRIPERYSLQVAILVFILCSLSFALPITTMAQGLDQKPTTQQEQTPARRKEEEDPVAAENSDPGSKTTTAGNETPPKQGLANNPTPDLEASKPIADTETIRAGTTLTTTQSFTATSLELTGSKPITIAAGSTITNAEGKLTFDNAITVTFSYSGTQYESTIPLSMAREFTSTSEITTTLTLENKKVEVVSARNAITNLRSGPGTDFPEIGTLPTDTGYEVIQKQKNWLQIELEDGSLVWVASWVVNVSENKLSTGGLVGERELAKFLANSLGIPESEVNLVHPSAEKTITPQEQNPDSDEPIVVVDSDGNVLGTIKEFKLIGGATIRITFQSWRLPKVQYIPAEKTVATNVPTAAQLEKTAAATIPTQTRPAAQPTPQPAATATPTPKPAEVVEAGPNLTELFGAREQYPLEIDGFKTIYPGEIIKVFTNPDLDNNGEEDLRNFLFYGKVVGTRTTTVAVGGKNWMLEIADLGVGLDNNQWEVRSIVYWIEQLLPNGKVQPAMNFIGSNRNLGSKFSIQGRSLAPEFIWTTAPDQNDLAKMAKYQAKREQAKALFIQGSPIVLEIMFEAEAAMSETSNLPGENLRYDFVDSMSDSSNTSGTRFSGPDGVAQNSEAPILGQAMRVFLPPKNS